MKNRGLTRSDAAACQAGVAERLTVKIPELDPADRSHSKGENMAVLHPHDLLHDGKSSRVICRPMEKFQRVWTVCLWLARGSGFGLASPPNT
jgi:hypothetical protein